MLLNELANKNFLNHIFVSHNISQVDLQENDIGMLEQDTQENQYKLIINEKVLYITVKDVLSKQTLDAELYRNNANLAQVEWRKDNQFQLKILFFKGQVISFPAIEVGITDRVMNQARKLKIKSGDVANQLIKDCALKVNGDTYICAKVTLEKEPEGESQIELENLDDNIAEINDEGVSDDNSINGDDEQAIKSKTENTDDLIDSIAIYGATYRLPIKKKVLISGVTDQEQLLLTALQPNHHASDIYQLIKVDIKWVKESEAQTISAYAKNKLDKLTADNSSYFKIWDKYTKKEMEFLQQRVEGIGTIELNNVENCENGLRIYTQKNYTKLLRSGKNGDMLAITTNFTAKEESYTEIINDTEHSKNDNNTNEETVKVIEVKPNYIEVEPFGYQANDILQLSTVGDKEQVKRREKARQRILTGTSANPNLGLIIEGADGVPIPQKPLRPIQLNPELEKKIFRYGATPTQKKAVELALNTPDIMLIQGPPGTGKTTVITAILEQLNAISDKKGNLSGQVLISAFQHDAVDNLTGRLTVNDIPVIKFSRNDEHKYRNLDSVSRWAKQITNFIEQQQLNIYELEELKLIDTFGDAYKHSPSQHQAIKLLTVIKSLKQVYLDKEDEESVNRILNELNSQNQVTAEKQEFKLIGAIRLTEMGFRDDGLSILIKIKESFADLLSEKDLDLLNSVIDNPSLPIADILSMSKKIKKQLLDIFKPKPIFTLSKPRKDILQILDKVRQLSSQQRQHIDKKEQILFDFRNELMNNPYGLSKALEQYNSIYAATVQQSVGKQIIEAKNKSNNSVYDTVIIDEAARVGAMDLLIPMSQAKNRIILVGDHRQLPHMIEEAIIEQIQSEDDYDEYMVNNYLKDSIFAYLFNLLKKLEQKDGIVRTITLDAQYRSHPLLGEFASRCFYQPYNEDYQSPTEAKAFEHQLAGIENKAAIWLDVPHAINEKETKEGTSRYRDAEVKAIVQYLKQWLNDEENQDLSFGIITFYSEQVKRLEKLLRLEGIYLEDINRDKERLRIGSVDAFQGTEFDIVFLSIVRTKSNEELAKIDAYDTRKINQTFGFLVSKNRLCVAVTRQKRALIVVGNAQMVQSDIGQQAVPELGEFYQLCTKSEQGAVL